jgi:hypothetical protein
MGGAVSAVAEVLVPQTATHDHENRITNFFRENLKVLSSRLWKKEDPHLVMLRMILGCEYGRPKFIQFLVRTTAIRDFVDDETNSFKIDHQNSFVVEEFLSKYQISTSDVPLISENSDALPPPDSKASFPYFILITVVSSYHHFLNSREHTDWMKYQQMIRISNSVISPHTLVSGFSCDQIAKEIQSIDYRQFLNQSYWIVALASLLDMIPFPVSILGQPHGPLGKKANDPPRIVSNSQSMATVSPSVPTMMILFGNNAFVEMVGETREDIALCPFDKYHCPAGSCSSGQPPALSVGFDTSARVAVMFHPQTPLKPFLNLQSYLPLSDPQGDCHYLLVTHCDISRSHQHPKYLQMLSRLTDILSQAIIPQREHSATFLLAYFYHQQATEEQTHAS